MYGFIGFFIDIFLSLIENFRSTYEYMFFFGNANIFDTRHNVMVAKIIEY